MRSALFNSRLEPVADKLVGRSSRITRYRGAPDDVHEAIVPRTSKPRLPANALAKLRVDAHLSTSAAADHLGIEEGDLSRIESGIAQAPALLLANMARLYSADPHTVVKAYLADQIA